MNKYLGHTDFEMGANEARHRTGGSSKWRWMMTKQGVITAVLDCTQKLGHVPSHIELMKNTAVSRTQIRGHFGTYAGLLRECELEGSGSGYRVEMDDLFRDS